MYFSELVISIYTLSIGLFESEVNVSPKYRAKANTMIVGREINGFLNLPSNPCFVAAILIFLS